MITLCIPQSFLFTEFRDKCLLFILLKFPIVFTVSESAAVFKRNPSAVTAGRYNNNLQSTGQNTDKSINGATTTPKPLYMSRSGLSAWGIITLILVVILLGMIGYYGIICYPFICSQNRSYGMMDSESTSSGTPTRSTDFDKFEKLGNYSSRSTTPSKSHE